MASNAVLANVDLKKAGSSFSLVALLDRNGGLLECTSLNFCLNGDVTFCGAVILIDSLNLTDHSVAQLAFSLRVYYD